MRWQSFHINVRQVRHIRGPIVRNDALNRNLPRARVIGSFSRVTIAERCRDTQSLRNVGIK